MASRLGAIAVLALPLLALAPARAAPTVPPRVDCRYTARVVTRTELSVEVLCSAAYTDYTVAADRSLLVVATPAGFGSGSSTLLCSNRPEPESASELVACDGYVVARRKVVVLAMTSPLCEPIRLVFTVTKPYENRGVLTLRARCQ